MDEDHVVVHMPAQAAADLIHMVEDEGNAIGRSTEAGDAITRALEAAGWKRNDVHMYEAPNG